MLVSYKEQDRYRVAAWLLSMADREQKWYRLDEQSLSVEVKQETLYRMLERFRDSKAILFPGPGQTKEETTWMLTAPTLFQLEQARVRIQHLLVPAYAGLPQKVSASSLAGARARQMPHGYYRLRSRSEYIHEIFRLLDLWMYLEKERPDPKANIVPPTYGELYERLRMALAEAQWEEAERVRHEIQLRNLTSAENLLFLEIEVLACQQRWREIWRREDFSSLARVPIPRAVRAALLMAFHYVELLPKEQQGDWQGAMEAFSVHQPRLGLLLGARLGLSQGPVVQVFAYHAARHNNRAELQELITATSDLTALECVKQLLRLSENVPVSATVVEPAGVLQLARSALEEANYDLAASYAQQVEDEEARLILLLRISFYTRDIQQAENALLLYWDISPERLPDLHLRYPFVAAIASDLTQLIAPEIPEEEAQALQSSSIRTWLDWFQRVLAQPDDENLSKTLVKLTQTTDERFWEQERLETLNELLLQVVVDDRLATLPLVRNALGKLISFFLNDSAFPRTEPIYQELYESFYTTIIARTAHEEMLFSILLQCLVDAVLRVAPGKCETIMTNLRQWSGQPLPKMELWILDTYELLIEYGLYPQQLASWCREWLEKLFLVPDSGQIQWQTWLALAQVIQPGEDLLTLLMQKLASVPTQEDEDILASLVSSSGLNSDYVIGIYTLHQGSAARARDLLQARNSRLKIRICTDTVMTASAKALALHADLAVVVATAITHNLFYSISPYLKEHAIAYPQSSGSISIVRAIEEYARKQDASPG